ncbi:REC [Musa troglodytarum]|uniref:REC n=1 Tax=Musa troglodytarum TaxID=320322 RepID=A0A9E7KDU5_9LILI|nr:REC [Musa troglodytarum]
MEEVEKREEGGNDGMLEGGVEVRVLVVDDSPVDRRIVEGLLKKSGAMFQVTSVDSGKRAMEVLGLSEDKTKSPVVDGQKVDIILTDYCMPEMTGYDLLKAVKERSCKKPIPVIVMSSENEPQRINRCRAIGAEDFIIKPLQTNDVLRLRSYARTGPPPPPPSSSSKAGTKRKMTIELMAESGGGGSERRRPRLTGLAMA